MKGIIKDALFFKREAPNTPGNQSLSWEGGKRLQKKTTLSTLQYFVLSPFTDLLMISD